MAEKIVLRGSFMAERKPKVDLRRDDILKLLYTEGCVSVVQLSEAFGVTEVTIRNDLTALEQEGLLLRVHGGAVLAPGPQSPLTSKEEIVCLSQKRAIAETVANMIRDGDTLFINTGTTGACVADALRVRKNLRVVTNSIAVATALGGVPSIRVTLLGGDINAQYGFTYGNTAQEQIRQYRANWALLSVDGITPTGGVANYHAEEVVLDRMMISGAARTVITADSTKVGRPGFSRICDCDSSLTLITNTCEQSEVLQQLQACGMQIVFAQL